MSADDSTELQRKRVRDDSFPLVSKRFRQSPPGLAAYSLDDDLEIVSQNFQSELSECSGTPRGRTPTEAELKHNALIFVVEDDEDDELIEIPGGKSFGPKKKKGEASRPLNKEYLLIDLDEQEDFLYREEMRLATSCRSDSPQRHNTFVSPMRNLPITLPWAIKDFAETYMGRLRPGDVVEIKGRGFLRIIKIIQNLETDEIKFRGHQLERVRNLNGILPKKINELCWLIDIELDDQRPAEEQDVEEVSLQDIARSRKLVMTNQRYPAGSFRETGGFFDPQNAKEYAQLCLRWKYCCVYQTASDRQNNKWLERRLEHLRNDDLSKGDLIVPNAKLRVRFRGETILGGAYRPDKRSKSVKSLEVFCIDNEDRKRGTEIIDFTRDDALAVEDLRKSVSILDLSDITGQKCPSTSGSQVDNSRLAGRAKAPERRASQIPLGINLSGSSVVTPPDSGMVQGHSTRSFSSTSANHCVRKPGQKYTYGDCCEFSLITSLSFLADNPQSVGQEGRPEEQ